VAMDHGFFNEPSFLAGIEEPSEAILCLLAAGPDAIQLPPGTARILQSFPGPKKPALVLRTDSANVYGRDLPPTLHSELVEDATIRAVQLDAACVVVNLLSLPGQSALLDQCVRNAAKLRAESYKYGMPLMIEPLVMQDNRVSGGYMVDGDLERIRALVRTAVELGADVIKCDPCAEINDFHEVVRVAGPIPVLVRGGGRVPDAELFARTVSVMQQGATGIVYGRNIIQHAQPTAITQALMGVVHEDWSPEEAMHMMETRS